MKFSMYNVFSYGLLAFILRIEPVYLESSLRGWILFLGITFIVTAVVEGLTRMTVKQYVVENYPNVAMSYILSGKDSTLNKLGCLSLIIFFLVSLLVGVLFVILLGFNIDILLASLISATLYATT